jgi:callose synthase
VIDFRDWKNWLLYSGGIGVEGEESWEAWWEEELVFNIFHTLFEMFFLLLYLFYPGH